MAAYQLNIGVGGLRQIATAAAQMQGMVRSAQQLKQLGAGGGGGGGSRSGSSGGPLARLNSAQQALAANPGSFDAQYRAMQAQKAYARAQEQLNGGPGFGKRLSNAVLSTRFNFGGQRFGVSPLVGQSLKAMGLSGGQAAGAAVAITAVVLAFEAATLGIKLFIHAIRSAAESLHEMSAARQITGGTSGNIAGLQAMGLNVGQIPGLANSLAGTLSSNGMAMGQFGAQAPGIFGPSDRAGRLNDVIQQIAGIADPIQRLTAARNAELDSILPQIEAYRRSKAVIDQDAKARSVIGDPETLRAADDFNLALARVGFNFTSLVQSLGKPFLKDSVAMLMTVADVLRAMATELNGKPELLTSLLKPLREFFKMLIYMGVQLGVLDKGTVAAIDAAFTKHRNDMDSANAQIDASNRVADSLDNLAGILNKPGIYGGGPMAQGWGPSALRGRALDQALAGGALRLGAFAI